MICIASVFDDELGLDVVVGGEDAAVPVWV